MDSVTQFSLGAVVSVALIGKKIGPRKAAIIGGALGTLPDLDVFLPFDDPVDAFVLHRGWTHSFFVHLLAAPLIGEVIVRSFGKLSASRWLVWLTVFLCLSTHAMIDAITVYGTRIFWPFYPDPVGIGSVFIIDPIYSLPLLIIVIWSLLKKTVSPRMHMGVMISLIFTTAYLALSLGLQAHIEQRARTVFAEAGIKAQNIFAIAAPLNIVVWKVMGQEQDRYHNLYLSLFDKDEKPRIYTHRNGSHLKACLTDNEAFKKLEWFSRGYYRLQLQDNKIVFSDIRMGLTPNYVFKYAIAEKSDEGVRTIAPRTIKNEERVSDQDFEWLAARLVGQPSTRNAEILETERNNNRDAHEC